MHTIRVWVQPTMKVNTYNQCPDFKLIYRKYFSNGADCIEDPAKEVDIGSMNSVDLMPFRAVFEGALMYELERKHVRTGNRPEPTDLLLFVAWKSEGYKKFCVFLHLIECNKGPYWDLVKLEEYYQRYVSQLRIYTDPIEDTWLIYDGTVLMVRLDLDFTQRDGVLNMTISEGLKDDHTKRPEWVDLEK
jgi:hypothetical protein